MKQFLHVHHFYNDYLRDFNRNLNNVETLSYEDLLKILLEDSFGAVHHFGKYLNTLNAYSSQMIIPNCFQLQYKWCLENGYDVTKDPTNFPYLDVLKMQVEKLQPEILYLATLTQLPSDFVSSLNYSPELVLGWHGVLLGDQKKYFYEVDTILSNSSIAQGEALKLQAQNVDFLFPGFPRDVFERTKKFTKEYDVVFIGHVTSQHINRKDYLEQLADYVVSNNFPFQVDYFVNPTDVLFSKNFQTLNHGAVWGMKMNEVIAKARIVLNCHIDFSENEAANMRLFETTGIGSFLLTDAQENLENYFSKDEVGTFESFEKLVSQVEYYLDNEKEREKMAKRAQVKCHSKYSMQQSLKNLDGIIQKYTQLTLQEKESLVNEV